ncbi:hypothetical protein MLD38_000403 [Melastoma candidum]|uniref:Uncharacterized protein n=1 Tax=Melastoma candidum TaxID=119954 RepID=A0ACB9SIK4_9MYRT|nr:hypothetical protein MLD38_000403 [Melastoma candidum]
MVCGKPVPEADFNLTEGHALVLAGSLDGSRAGLADRNPPAREAGFRTVVGVIRPVLEAERRKAAIAVEGEEIQPVAIRVAAVFAQSRATYRIFGFWLGTEVRIGCRVRLWFTGPARRFASFHAWGLHF